MRRLAAITSGLLLLAPRALLAHPVNCSDTADPLGCRMDQFLNWLHFAAVVLGLVLVAVAVVAVRYIQRNRRSSDKLPMRKKDSRR